MQLSDGVETTNQLLSDMHVERTALYAQVADLKLQLEHSKRVPLENLEIWRHEDRAQQSKISYWRAKYTECVAREVVDVAKIMAKDLHASHTPSQVHSNKPNTS